MASLEVIKEKASSEVRVNLSLFNHTQGQVEATIIAHHFDQIQGKGVECPCRPLVISISPRRFKVSTFNQLLQNWWLFVYDDHEAQDHDMELNKVINISAPPRIGSVVSSTG